MSLIVTINVNEGIVMASDSRSSVTMSELLNDGSDGNLRLFKEKMVHFSDTSYKTFLMDGKIGISTCGNATINKMPISGYIEEFIRENSGCMIDELPKKIRDYFQKLEPNKKTTFFIAGYSQDDTGIKQKVFRVNTNVEEEESIEVCNTSFPCARWDGERDVASRLFTDLYIKREDEEGNTNYIRHTFYDLATYHFTLQDAIEFSEFLVSATINSMKFQLRAKTVGGPVDILVIKPQEAFWIQRKELHV